jgi:predicted nucleotide-binding protein (sugar kinase/HSP70/actin superfamily)
MAAREKMPFTILAPDMLPVHFEFITEILRQSGYNVVILPAVDKRHITEGLKGVHNDACYPALIVIGQFINALKSGEYDPDKTALLISQTGGGCRASNYIHMLRKALAAEFPQVPVFSINLSGLEKRAGLNITISMWLKFLFAVLYGDMLMSLFNQCLPYEKNIGDSKAVLDKWERRISASFSDGTYTRTKRCYRKILDDFAGIERESGKKIRVGVVGEIYVKYSPLANNGLEALLISDGCEPVVPALLDFILYCAVNAVNDSKLYGVKNKTSRLYDIGYRLIYKKQREMIGVIARHGVFEPPHDFEALREFADRFLHQGVKMGEGWLIPAEMAALAHGGVNNIVCAQPFGCLPNHIVARGMSRVIKGAFPEANIVSVDYDPGSTKVNQENRIKLMLANAKP